MNDFRDALLVPVAPEAFVVNDNVKKQGTFRRWQMEFNWLLNEYRNPEAAPFDSGESDVKRGVYLRWNLPDALKQGREGADSQIGFPLLPNRWLITRFSGPSTALRVNSWLIKSDALGETDGSRYLKQHGTGLAISRLGHCIPVTDWSAVDEENSPELFLTAVGYGHTAFMAYQPFVRNVFSFFDPLDGVDTGKPLAYLIIGWYSRPESDILLHNRLSDLRWVIKEKGQMDGVAPKTGIYHGLVYDINYGAASHINNNRKNIQVAVGNTSVEAFVALMKQWAGYRGLKEEAVQAELFRAFQYDLLNTLDAPDGEESLELAARKFWYQGAAGGYLWEIVDTNSAPQNAPPPRLTPVEETLLADLRGTQTRFEREGRNLAALQQHLYEVWWKSKLLTKETFMMDAICMFIPGYDNMDRESKDRYRTMFEMELKKLLAEIASKNQEITRIYTEKFPGLPAIAHDMPINALEQRLNEYFREKQVLAPERLLKARPKPHFWTVNDPVVMVTGVHQSSGLRSGAELPCRTPEQVVTGGEGAIIPPVILKGAPELIQKLGAEAVLLGQGNLPPGVGGVKPDARAVSKWVQPWQPLFMEWEVQWYPIPYENWEFDGRDFRFDGGCQMPENAGVKIKGRNILTPHNTGVLRTKLEKLAGEQETVKGFLAGLDEWDFISQQLTGFNHQLIQRSSEFLLPPGLEIGDAVRENGHLLPELKNRTKNFQEIRQGQFIINQLIIYDAFGQVLGIVEDSTRKYPSLYSSKFFAPIRETTFQPNPPERTVVPHNRHRFVQLPPRILHPCRLNFTFADARNDEDDTERPGVNPVCGWLIPDRLRVGILIYDQSGIYLGAVRSTAREEVLWVPAPGEIVLPNNLHLSQIIDTLKSLPVIEFQDFVALIDETLWTIDSAVAQNDLAVFTGRPLAIVRAGVELETAGPVMKDPFWPGPDHREDSLLSSLEFDVRIGNAVLRKDGVIGYFTPGEQGRIRFNAVQTGKETALFLRRIGPGNFLPVRINHRTMFTLLLDPAAGIHLETGILPPQQIDLPERYIHKALRRMEIVLPCGPLLTTLAQAGKDGPGQAPVSIRLPKLPETGGRWTWLEETSQGLRQYGLEDPGTATTFHEPVKITEGFLKYTKSRKEDKNE